MTIKPNYICPDCECEVTPDEEMRECICGECGSEWEIADCYPPEEDDDEDDEEDDG